MTEPVYPETTSENGAVVATIPLGKRTLPPATDVGPIDGPLKPLYDDATVDADSAVITAAIDTGRVEVAPPGAWVAALADPVHLMSSGLLDACGTSPGGTGLRLTPVIGQVTCPACRLLSVIPTHRSAPPEDVGSHSHPDDTSGGVLIHSHPRGDMEHEHVDAPVFHDEPPTEQILSRGLTAVVVLTLSPVQCVEGDDILKASDVEDGLRARLEEVYPWDNGYPVAPTVRSVTVL